MNRYLVPIFGFVAVAVASFAMWAFGAGRWFQSTASLYTACAVTFLMLGGFSLLPFSGRAGATTRAVDWRILWLFPLGFLVFSICWCVGWFNYPSHYGEILGSAVGIFGLTWIFRRGLRFKKSTLEAASVVFASYTIGYYLGEKAYQEIAGWPGKLGWGAGFGIGLGIGLVYLIQLSAQSRNVDK